MNPVVDTEARDAARRIADAELSTASRIAHGAMLAAALTMTLVVVSLGLTEPNLPPRAVLAFAVLAAIGSGWTGYAIWVLTQRRVLYVRQRVVAGWMAVSFTSVFTAGALAAGIMADIPAGFVAAGLGVILMAAAAGLLLRARRRLSELTTRRTRLEAGHGAST